jgi:CspA family cold shock protein
MAQRIRGVVKWFSAEKGYGFITPDNGPDVFVHYSAIQANGYRKLEAGEQVEFEITEGPKGKQASSVTAV